MKEIFSNRLGWIRVKFFVCDKISQVFLSLVDTEEVCMGHMSLSLLKGLVARFLVEPKCPKFYF